MTHPTAGPPLDQRTTIFHWPGQWAGGHSLYSFFGVMGLVAVHEFVSVDLHQVEHGEGVRVLVHFQRPDVALLHGGRLAQQ